MGCQIVKKFSCLCQGVFGGVGRLGSNRTDGYEECAVDGISEVKEFAAYLLNEFLPALLSC